MKISNRHIPRIVALVCTLMLSLATATALAGAARGVAVSPAPGNDGVLKIHEQGTPSGTEDNDPKVCVFNVEGFNLDPDYSGILVFSVQGGDGPTGVPAGPYDFGPTDANGYYATQYFNLQPGHYKATLYDKPLPGGELEDVKAKSKVFKVICEEASPSPSVSPSESESPSPSPSTLPSEGVSPSASVLPFSTASLPPPGTLPSAGARPGPGELALTGAKMWVPIFGLAMLTFGIALVVAVRRRPTS